MISPKGVCPQAALAFLIVATVALRPGLAAPADYFGVHVVDEQTGRGVPLVELRTTFKARYYTDSNGYVAFMEPGLAGQDVWFDIRTPGYESPEGPFGTQGKAFKIEPGKIGEVKLKRTNIAERLYRMTGYGIYRDTVLLGKKPPIKEGLIDGLVCGSDTVQCAIFKGKYYWFWQDTDRLSFPLGNFDMTGAIAALPDKLNLENGIDFTYFTEKPGGFARKMADVPQKESHPVWADGLTVVKDEHGNEHMLSRFMTANKDMSANERGLLEWNDSKQIFEVLKKFDSKETLGPGGKPFPAQDGNTTYYYFPSPYALVRVKADYASASDPAQYEAFTCLKSGSSNKQPIFNRDGGKLVWSWQKNTRPVEPKQVQEWIKSNQIKRDETPFQMRETDKGKDISVAGGSIAWNPLLKKWTMLFGQSMGDTVVGELWFATANAPEGPWRDAIKVATHAKPKDNNDCYNPIQHEELMQGGGRYVYFEGTFVNTFSGNPSPTPYYDYNNLMYRLDVTDPRLKLPEPPAAMGTSKPITAGNE